MTKVALRGLLTRKLRSVLTGFAVVIGVAFVVGTLVFTDTINESFKNLFERTQKGVDVELESRQAVKADFSTPPTMPASVLDKVKATPGVKIAEGSVSSDVTLLDKKGKAIVSNGPPTLAVSESDAEDLPGPRLRERRPAADRRRGGDRPRHGQEVRLQGRRHRRWSAATSRPSSYKVSGVASLDGKDNLAGARLVVMTLPEAQRVTGHDGYDSISISTGGADPNKVKATLQQQLGRSINVRTGKEAAEQQAQDLSDALGFLRTGLLVFAAVALLVGGFLIFNTFSVTVAQRTKEFALLRVLGASRRQVLRSVLVETFVVGLAGVDPRRARRLRARARARGDAEGVRDRPGHDRARHQARDDRSPACSSGLIATMVSGFIPARRATRVRAGGGDARQRHAGRRATCASGASSARWR